MDRDDTLRDERVRLLSQIKALPDIRSQLTGLGIYVRALAMQDNDPVFRTIAEALDMIAEQVQLEKEEQL